MSDDSGKQIHNLRLSMIAGELVEVKTLLQVVVEMLRRQLTLSGVPEAELDDQLAQRAGEIRKKMQEHQLGLIDKISESLTDDSKP